MYFIVGILSYLVLYFFSNKDFPAYSYYAQAHVREEVPFVIN